MNIGEQSTCHIRTSCVPEEHLGANLETPSWCYACVSCGPEDHRSCITKLSTKRPGNISSVPGKRQCCRIEKQENQYTRKTPCVRPAARSGQTSTDVGTDDGAVAAAADADDDEEVCVDDGAMAVAAAGCCVPEKHQGCDTKAPTNRH